MKEDYSILCLCHNLMVSPSGYYEWQKRKGAPGARALENQLLAQKIEEIHADSRKTYGSPRILRELRKTGFRHGRNRIGRLMKQKGLVGRQRVRWHPQTTDSNHDQPIAPNRLAEAKAATAPNQIWVADITYIQTKEGWLYLAAVLDLYSRRIVGWSMSPHIDTALVLKALSMAILHRKAPKNLLFHSDRGVQYASSGFREALAQANLLPSMSRKANCYDNATMESFWSTLKLELVYRTTFPTHDQARREIFDYIECFYNRHRSHSSLNYCSPFDFELQNN